MRSSSSSSSLPSCSTRTRPSTSPSSRMSRRSAASAASGAGPRVRSGAGFGSATGPVPLPFMAKTLFDRIWESHVVHEADGEPALLYVDLHLIHEVTSPQAFDGLRLAGARSPPGSLARDDGPQRPDRRRPGRPALARPARGAARELRGVRRPPVRDRQRARGDRPRHRPRARPHAAGDDDRLRGQPHLDARRVRRRSPSASGPPRSSTSWRPSACRGSGRRRCGSSIAASCRSGSRRRT